MIYTPVSKALKSANDNSRTKVAACGLRNAKRYLLFQGRLLACVSFISYAFTELEWPCLPIGYQTMGS